MGKFESNDLLEKHVHKKSAHMVKKIVAGIKSGVVSKAEF